MFSAVAGMASMFGLKRKEETQTAVLEDIYGDLQQIKKSFKITIVPASEEREKEFDKEKRHQELLAAFKRAGLAMRRSASSRDGDKDKDKKGNWLSKLAMGYFSYRVLKGFIKKFFKIMRLGRLWVLLRGLGFILVRLFWPLAVAAALIWVIPKIIDNWPEIVETAKNTLDGIWDTLKGWYSWFQGVSQEIWLWALSPIMEANDISREEILAGVAGNTANSKPIWDEAKGMWMVGNTPLPGIAKNEKSKAISYANMMGATASTPPIQQTVVAQSPIVGVSGFQHDDSGVADNAIVGVSGFQHDDSGIADTPDIVQPQNTYTPFQSAAAERGRGGQIKQNRMTDGNYNVANYQKQVAMNWDRDYAHMGDNDVIGKSATAQQNLDAFGVTGTWTPSYSKDHERYSEDKGSWKVRSSDLKGKQNANWARINKEKPLTAGMLANEQSTNQAEQIKQQKSAAETAKFWAGQKAAQEQRMPTVPGKLIPKLQLWIMTLS